MSEATRTWRICTTVALLAISIRNVKAPFQFGSSSTDASSSQGPTQKDAGNPTTTIPTINVQLEKDNGDKPLAKPFGAATNLAALGKANPGGGLKSLKAMGDLTKLGGDGKSLNLAGLAKANQKDLEVPPAGSLSKLEGKAADNPQTTGKAPENKKGLPPKTAKAGMFNIGSGSYSVSVAVSSDLPTVPGAPSAALDNTGDAIVNVAAKMIADCAEIVAQIVEQKPEMERLACQKCLINKNSGSSTFNLPIGLFETFHDSVDAFLNANKLVKRHRMWHKFRKQSEGVLRWALKESLKHLPPKALTVVAGRAAPLCVACAAPVVAVVHKETNELVKIFLDCVKKLNGDSTKVDDLPEDFFKEFVHAVEEKANAHPTKSKKFVWLTVLAGGAEFKAFVEKVIAQVDKDFISEQKDFCPNPGAGGQLLHDDVQKIISGGGDSNKAISFMDLFSKDYDRVDEEPLGDAKNKFGVAYLVKETQPADKANAQQVVMKVTRFGADPQEFPNHEALFNHPFKVDNKFVPEIVAKKKPSTKGDLEFYVMEYLGPTFFNLLQPGEKLKDYVLSFAETLFAVGRMYHVLKMIHSANYVHRDAHYNNWMFSRKNQYTLVLIDYGKSRHLSKYDYFHVTTDLYKWAHLALVLCKEAKIDDYPDEAKQSFAKVKETLENIEMELKKFMWQHPGTSRILPYDKFYPKTYDEYQDSDLLKQVDDLVDSILETKAKRGINDETPLTRWKPDAKKSDKDKQPESSSADKDTLKVPATSIAGKAGKSPMSLSANALHQLATSHHESDLFLSCEEAKGISAKDAPILGAQDVSVPKTDEKTDAQSKSSQKSSASIYDTAKSDVTDDYKHYDPLGEPITELYEC